MEKISEQQIQEFIAAFPSAKQNEPMAAHSSMKIGGPARLYFIASNNEDLLKAVAKASELQIPFYIISGGSNILVSDDGFPGVIIQSADRSFKLEDQKLRAAAGAITALVARAAGEAGLTGFEWGVGVPGAIGGATYGNAGCFGGDMKDVVTVVEAYNLTTNQLVTYSNSECRFGYRDSRFKHESHVILYTSLELQAGDKATVLKKMEDIMAKRKASQPQGDFSAGCLFKNFEFKDDSELEILRRQVSEIPEEMLQNRRLPAGWLIDQLGLKGTKIGKAQISSVHGNFVVNLGGARAQDILALSSLVKMKVRDEFGILLEDEVQLVGF